MIFTDRTITVRKGESRIDEPIVVYRGDYELEVRFTISNSRFKFMSGTNMIESEKASYGQLAILTPYGDNIFSDIVQCNDGSVTFVLTAEMLNQIEEVGLYSFQIRLMDYTRESRVSIPPVEFGIEVREPIASEDHDNSVNNAIVGYSIAKVVDPKEENVGDTFDENGNYNKTKWETGDRISEGKLNKIEDAIDKINENEVNNTAVLSRRIDNNFNVLDSIMDEIKQNSQEEIREIESELAQTNAQLSDITIVMRECVGDGVTDNSTVIQNVIDRVNNHATLKFLDGVFKLNTDIDYRDKTIKILVSEKTEFIGVGRFPTYETNPWHEQNGNNFIIKPSHGKIWNNEKCGDSAISCEVSPTRSYQGNAVAGFFSAKTNDCQGDVWALNPIVKVDKNFKGTAQGMEIDIDNMSEYANVTGLTLTGWGAYNPENAIFISRHNTDDNTHTYWKTGVMMKEVVNGVGVMGAKDNGLVVVEGKKGGYIASNQECGLELTNNHVDLSIHGSSNGVIIENTDEPIKIIAKAGNDYSASIYGTNSENNAVMYKILQNGEGHFSSLNIDDTIIASGLIASSNQPLRLTSENGEVIIVDGRTKQILPENDNGWDIGSSSKKFKGIFLVNSPVVTSKREMKENIKLFNDETAYESIKKIPIYTYNYIDGDGENMIGSMLDELPIECINEHGEGVDLYAYTSYCISALKVAIKKIEELESKIGTIE